MHYRGNELKKTAGKALKRHCETQGKSRHKDAQLERFIMS